MLLTGNAAFCILSLLLLFSYQKFNSASHLDARATAPVWRWGLLAERRGFEPMLIVNPPRLLHLTDYYLSLFLFPLSCRALHLSPLYWDVIKRKSLRVLSIRWPAESEETAKWDEGEVLRVWRRYHPLLRTSLSRATYSLVSQWYTGYGALLIAMCLTNFIYLSVDTHFSLFIHGAHKKREEKNIYAHKLINFIKSIIQ